MKLQPRERLEATPRKAMTPTRRQLVLDAYCGLCAEPGCRNPPVEIDHILPLELSGTEAFDNLQPLCDAHHKLKTKFDRQCIDKMRRQAKLVQEPEPSKRPIRSRGFEGWRSFSGEPRKARA